MALADASPFAVAHWTLDESSGTRVDSVGSNDLTDNNTVGVGTGKFGNAADFESNNSEYLTASDSASLSSGDVDFCVRCWVKIESKPGSNMALVGRWGVSAGSVREWILYFNNSSDRLQFYVTTSAGATAVVTASNLGSPPVGSWLLLHAWHDAANNQIGIAANAGTANTTSHSGGVRDGSANITIGRNDDHGGENYFDGLIDDVVILQNYILDATERTADYSGGDGVAFADWAVGGTTPSGSASVNAVASLSVSGQTTRTGEADPVGVAAISVAGTAPNGGTASVSDVASIAATGHHLATASCSIDAIASLTVEGEAIRNGAVSIDAIASLSPSGTAPVVGTASGAASVVAVAGLSVVGETETSGSVSVDAIAGISVSGTAPSVDEASGAVSVDAVASLSIAAQTTRTGESDVVAVASLAASGTAPNSGSVTLSAVASVAVSGQSSSQSIVPFQWYALLLAT